MKDNDNSNKIKAEFYVTSPKLQKDKLTQYTVYSIITKKLSPILRRYSEFNALRQKMQERWPGVYIPSIPPKTWIGKFEKEIVDFRLKMISRFCSKISSRDYLLESSEIKIFLDDHYDIKQKLSSLNNHTYEDLVFKYAQAFPDYDDTLDLSNAKEHLMQFNVYITQSLPNLIEFRGLVIKVRDRTLSDINRDLQVFELFSLFEKDNLIGNDKDTRLYFTNNREIKESSDIQPNHYDSLFEKISSDILDLEAFQEALNGIISLQIILNNTQNQLKVTSNSIEKVKRKGISIEKLLSFKKEDDYIFSKAKEQEKIQNNITNLNTVINMVTFQLDKEIKEYNKTLIEEYYTELNNLSQRISNINDVNVKFYDRILSSK